MPRQPLVMDELSRIDIDLPAIGRNLAAIRRIVGSDCHVCAVVKADAYGLGMQRVVPALESAGADMLAVFSPYEAGEVLATSCRLPILIFMPVRELTQVDPLYPGVRSGQVHLVVHDPDHLDRLEKLAEELDVLLRVHLKINTGMHRGGCSYDDAPVLLERIMDCRRLHLAGLCTHFSSSTSCHATTESQLELFESFIQSNEHLIDSDCLLHCASTSSIVLGARYHKNMVRVGLGWVGTCPAGEDAQVDQIDLESVVRWTSRIVHVRSVSAGQPVGYDGTWCPRRESVIGVIPVGYADGYPTVSTLKTQDAWNPVVGLLRQDRLVGHAPVVGMVSMDQLTVDLTDIHAHMQIRPGNRVELLSGQLGAPNSLRTLALATGVKPHALISRIHPGVRRSYLGCVSEISVVDDALMHSSSRMQAR